MLQKSRKKPLLAPAPKISQASGAIDALIIPTARKSFKAMTLDDEFLNFDLEYQVLTSENGEIDKIMMAETGQLLRSKELKYSTIDPLSSQKKIELRR